MSFECRNPEGEVVAIRPTLTDAIAKAQALTAKLPRKRCVVTVHRQAGGSQIAMVFRRPTALQRLLGADEWSPSC